MTNAVAAALLRKMDAYIGLLTGGPITTTCTIEATRKKAPQPPLSTWWC